MTLSMPWFVKSKTKAAILRLFFSQPEAEYYLRQIEALTGYSVGNIRREIAGLESDGLFLTRNLGKLKLYKLNKAYPLYSEINGIVRKTIGIEAGLKAALSRFNDIDFAFIYGSLADERENAHSDIDIIIIGSVKLAKIKSCLFDYQAKLGREINSIVYTREEFLNKVKNKNHFISAILPEKKIFIKGDQDEFGRFVQVRKAPKA